MPEPPVMPPASAPAPLDLAAIRARRAAITGAAYPWMRQGVRNDYGDNVFIWAVAEGSEYYSVEQQLAEGFGRAQICLMTGASTDADWEFIAAAPADIAALLAEVDRLRDLVDYYQAQHLMPGWPGPQP